MNENSYANTSGTLPPSMFPPQMQILSGSSLKLIACIFMLLDHTGHILLSRWNPANAQLFILFNRPISLYRIFRDLGRVAFPIFAFLLVEGFIHTRNRARYARNLFLFALISEVPFNLVFQPGKYINPDHQNVYFTLFFGFVGLCAWEYFQDKPALQLSTVALLGVLCSLMKTDYAIRGYTFIFIIYLFRYEKVTQALMGSLWLYYEWRACFAFISINMYNGKRGFIKGPIMKYAFYFFYPVHLIILLLIRKKFFL